MFPFSVLPFTISVELLSFGSDLYWSLLKFHKIFDLLLSVGPLDDIKSILAHFPSLVPLWTPISLIRSSFFGVKLICSSFNAKLQPLLLLGHQFDL